DRCLDYLYSDILRPLAEAFRNLDTWLRAMASRKEAESDYFRYFAASNFLATAEARETQLTAAIATRQAKVAEVAAGRPADEGPRKLAAATEALRAVEAELDSVRRAVADGRTSDGLDQQLRKLEKRRSKCLRRVDSFRSDNWIRHLSNEVNSA